MKPLSPNFLIRVPKKDEKDRSEKIDGVYLHPAFVWMTRNTQCGIIEGISKGAAANFPEAKIGDILIVHHFTQGSVSSLETTKRFLVSEDEDNHYYNVTSQEWNGQNNQTYGVWDGDKIIPHPEYLFLEMNVVKPILEETPEGIILSEWHQTPEEIQMKLERIKNDILNLTKQHITPEIVTAVQKKELEQMRLSEQLHQIKYLQYTIAYSHPTLSMPSGSKAYIKNNAVNTTIEFNNKEYRVCEKRYIGAV